ncbi:hypothetical protein [Oerskovia jenensis]|uniref:hypothetical protein n=1 Tax=Oerskovia jenensis TaxID=162169 RepID=UPI0036D821EC
MKRKMLTVLATGALVVGTVFAAGPASARGAAGPGCSFNVTATTSGVWTTPGSCSQARAGINYFTPSGQLVRQNGAWTTGKSTSDAVNLNITARQGQALNGTFGSWQSA